MVKQSKWKSIIGIILIWLGIIFDFPAVFGAFYIVWAIYDIKLGYTSIFMETVYKDENKFLFWVIVLTWIIGGIYVLAGALLGNWYLYSY